MMAAIQFNRLQPKKAHRFAARWKRQGLGYMLHIEEWFKEEHRDWFKPHGKA